jgi:hypothetical protein
MVIKSGMRELIDTGTDKRFVKCNQDGTFKDSVDISRSLAADRQQIKNSCEGGLWRSAKALN